MRLIVFKKRFFARWRALIYYIKWKTQRIIYFVQFLFHNYNPGQFHPKYIKHNMQIIFRVKGEEGLDSTWDGKLSLLSSRSRRFFFELKNIFLLGAFQHRVERVVFFTLLTVSLEIYNPFDRKILSDFLERKMALLRRSLEKIRKINHRRWRQGEVVSHIDAFHRNSLLQSEVISNMERAVRRQKAPPIVLEGQEAINRGLYPVLAIQGCSGAYWIRGADGQVLGIFKPYDEEIHAPNNPIGPVMQGALGQRRTRRGCRVGDAAHHEVGAFLVDSFLGFGIVPRTYYATFSHHAFYYAKEDRLGWRATKKKLGSFQEFVDGFVSLGDIKKTEMNAVPEEEFQLLVVLDLILGNTDRNIGNMLVGQEKIAAIDHGLCFPDCIEKLSFWYWSYFEHGKNPVFPTLVDLLRNFPLEELSWKLRKNCFISPNSLNRMKERIALFLAGASEGLVIAELEKLLIPEHLAPLQNLDATLTEEATHQVTLYKKSVVD